MITLRDYQIKGKDLISSRFAAGDKRVMLWAQTGAGKGLWMADFVKEANGKNLKVLSIMKRRSVIFQTIKNYLKYFLIKSVPIMGNLKTQFSSDSVVASIDTLARRISGDKFDYLKQFDLIITDECHDATSNSYKRVYWWLENLPLSEFSEKEFERLKGSFKHYHIGLTATPFRVGKKTHTFWQSVVKPIEAHELRDRGSLVEANVYAPTKIDVSGVRVIGDDYDQKELFERVSKLSVIGDVVETYKKYGQNLPAIGFCVNQRHSKIMAEAFRRAGIPAIHCDADHSQEERDEATAGLKSGKYKAIFNCNIFSVGFDAPFIEVEMGLRPSDSENLTLQQWGRVLRPYKVCANCGTEYGGDPSCFKCGSSETSYEKKRAIILDHANNSDRWGLPYDVRQAELEEIDRIRKNSMTGLGVKTCPVCFAVVHSAQRVCICNYDFVDAREKNQLEQLTECDGELVLVNDKMLKEKEYQKIKQRYNTYKHLELKRRWHSNSKYHKLYDEFGESFLECGSDFGLSYKMKKDLREGQLSNDMDAFLDNWENGKHENSKVYT